MEIHGCGYAADVDLMDNPEGLPTSSTTAWTTLRVDHISTTTTADLIFSKSKKNGKIKSMIVKE